MQRGITRRRSSTDEKDSFQDQGRSRQRQRRSAVESTASGCEEEDGPPTSFVRSTHPDHPSNTTSHTPMTTNMGHPIPSTNGSSSTNGAGSGPSGKGHSASSSVQPVRPKGKLMYEDDRDWSEHQDLADLVPDPEAEDVEMEDGVVGGDEGTRRRKVRPGIKGGKRMPVDREEVVRLVLQGLSDIGYR